MRLPLPFVLAALLVSGGMAVAADAPPRYAVELIAFRHLDQARITPEVPPPPVPDAGLAEGTGAPDERSSEADAPGFLLLDPRDDVAPARLAPGDLELGRLWARLETLDAYQGIWHGGWSQRAWPETWSIAVPVIAATPTGEALRGTVTLYQERFLHVAVDLALESGWGAADAGAAPAVEIRASRRLRGDRLEYFDAPGLGLLVQVRPLEAAAP